MKITQQELIEFADQQGLKIFGSGKVITSKIRAMQRLMDKGLLPKPVWKGGQSIAFWASDTEIKDRVIWLDEQREKGLSYNKIKSLLKTSTMPSDAMRNLTPLLRSVDFLIEIHPKVPDNYYTKAVLYEKAEERDKALELYKYILSNHEKDEKLIPNVFYSIIKICYLERRKKEEREYCERFMAYAMDKDRNIQGSAHMCMARYLQDIDATSSLQHYDKAEQLFTENTKLALLYAIRSYFEKNLNETEKARQHLVKAIELYPENSMSKIKAKAGLHVFYRDEGNYAGAIKCLLEAREILHQFKEIRDELIITYNLGCTYRLMGNYDEAIKWFRYTIDNLDPALHPASFKYIYKELSLIYEAMGNKRKADFYTEAYENIDKQMQNTKPKQGEML